MIDESVELREVAGPSALGGGRRRAYELLYLIAVNDFKKTYFGTVLGYVWSIARPLMMFGVLLVVFTHIFRLGSKVPHYSDFLLFDIVLFGFFQESTVMAVGSIVGHEAVVRKTQFPRLVIPLSVVFTSLFNLALNLLVAFAFILFGGISPRWTWLLLIPLLLALFVITTAICMIVSALYPRFRDVGIIWTVFSTALFYATPVLYPVSALHANLRAVIALNPLAPLFDLAQRWITNPRTPWPDARVMGGPWRLVIAITLYLVICGLAVWIFRREAPRIAEEL
ncbi:MAG: ABC transporter permease [Actinomycetota bacterium]|nr:ABC transporter permease [Actinomycetota bacterium]